MDFSKLRVSGNISTDPHKRRIFSHDASSYRITPAAVIEPKDIKDIAAVLAFAREHSIGVTCRSGGSGLSGAAVGPGIILNCKSFMKTVEHRGNELAAQPGVVLDDFLEEIQNEGLMLPAVPSSSAMCALGGNIGTRSTGPRTARYGTIDSFVSSLVFITAGGEEINTKNRLPDYLERGLLSLREQFVSDSEAMDRFSSRPFIAGGYNVKALADYSDPREIAAHLMVGSIGTLGVVSEIRLNLLPLRKSLGTYTVYFKNFDEIGTAVKEIQDFQPSAVEFIDAATMAEVDGEFLKLESPDIAGMLLIEFDENTVGTEESMKRLNRFSNHTLRFLQAGSREERQAWGERKQVLPSLWRRAKKKNMIAPSIIDDIAIHQKDFSPVYKELKEFVKSLGHEIYIFGHLGFGSLHARPFFRADKAKIRDEITEVSEGTFQILHRYKATLVGEHNAGRSRSVYLEQELGESFHYLRDIKSLFDPGDILNPGALFDTAPIIENLDLSS